jgi:hypothetical protein
MAKSKKKRGGSTTGRKTTARSGKAKSPKARARTQMNQAAAAGRANTSSGSSSPTTANPSQPRRMINRGPGDVGPEGGSRDRAGRQNAPKRAK